MYVFLSDIYVVMELLNHKVCICLALVNINQKIYEIYNVVTEKYFSIRTV